MQVPTANAIFFNGDRVQGTRNPVIERLSDLQKLAEILISKFGSSVNAWVIEASIFNGPFAVYKDFIPSVNRYGEPKSYNPVGFPASSSIVTLLSNCLKEVQDIISKRQKGNLPANLTASIFCQPKSIILGFSKGGTVINQLVTELSVSEVRSTRIHSQLKELPMSEDFSNFQEVTEIIPSSRESLLNSISEIHYVDVGLNSAGAYTNDPNVIERISNRITQGAQGLRFFLHGTPRQWCDCRRPTIRTEKDKLVELLEMEAPRTDRKLQVSQRFYFADRPPDLQMHFEIIEKLDVT
ncbi:UPF0565 protein C2orf69 [Tripterygium wilfordii]|uniref:UPF0565 protein C2orf69 n=1 Tax=Tripterygium wilfordii TaxID=458696 RepID=A0A7J7CFY3_TRIWF|nr:uncharacterized protein LOC119983005 isoform X2 [Tripterygium wilfordii]KAF5732875.1 UPF0565 protein C2orf69 [Tripterygium wilfordii]